MGINYVFDLLLSHYSIFFQKQLGFLFKYLITCTELGRQCRPVATTTRAVLLRKLQEMNVFMSDEREQNNTRGRWQRNSAVDPPYIITISATV